MSTYYVNAGGSNTSPFDTLEKGATNFRSLCDFVGSSQFQNGDIVEVIDDGVINDSASGLLFLDSNYLFTVTLRSHSSNTNKPTINLGVGSYFIGANVVQNLIMYRDRSLGAITAPYCLIAYGGSGHSSLVEGCIFYVLNASTDSSLAISLQQVTDGNYGDVRNNLINGFASGIYGYIDKGDEGDYWLTNLRICNNTIYCLGGIGIQATSFNFSTKDSELKVLNNIIQMGTGGTGILFSDIIGTSVKLLQDYNCLYGCTTEYSGTTSGTNNIDSTSGNNDPKFFTPGTVFTLQKNSPCINSGIDNTTQPSVPTIDILGVSRPLGAGWDMGAYEMEPDPSKSYFSNSSVVDNNSVISYIDASTLVTAIQAHNADTYFDSTDKIGKVVVYYTHEDNRQVKKILHKGSSLAETTSWSSFALDGTWTKSRILVHNHEGAIHDLPRSAIGITEDLTHSDGTMILNTI